MHVTQKAVILLLLEQSCSFHYMQQNYKVGIGLCNYYIITNCGQSLYTYCIIHVAGKDDKSEVVTTKEISNKGKEDLRT